MLHISICDDERIAVEKMQRIVENVLEQEHLLAKLETFENGEEFLKQYVIRDDELVILDLDMPVKNGIDVLQELEKIQRNEVVILVTAYDNLALKTFSYGPFQIVRKEQMEEDLPKAIGRFLNIRKRNQEESYDEQSIQTPHGALADRATAAGAAVSRRPGGRSDRRYLVLRRHRAGNLL